MNRPSRVRSASIALLAGALVLALLGGVAVARTTTAMLQRELDRLVAAPGGPVGAIATLYRNGRITVIRAGRANATRPGVPRLGDHMRIASVAKAFNGAVILHLVQQGRLALDDTIGQRLPGMPAAWCRVTVREMLSHTGGLPDYSKSEGAREHVTRHPRGFVSPLQLIDWVRKDPLRFPSGTRYEYSNTDNIVLGLIAERVTGESYGRLLSTVVFSPAGLSRTSFPTRQIALPAPFIHGYQVEAGKAPVDLTTSISPSGAWASGAGRLHSARSGRVHSCRADGPVLRSGTAQGAVPVRGGIVRSAGSGHELRRSRPLPLQNELRHRLWSHGQLPWLRPMGGGQRGWTPVSDHIAQYHSAHRRTARAVAILPSVRGLRAVREVAAAPGVSPRRSQRASVSRCATASSAGPQRPRPARRPSWKLFAQQALCLGTVARRRRLERPGGTIAIALEEASRSPPATRPRGPRLPGVWRRRPLLVCRRRRTQPRAAAPAGWRPQGERTLAWPEASRVSWLGLVDAEVEWTAAEWGCRRGR